MSDMLKVKLNGCELEVSGDAMFIDWAQKEFGTLALAHHRAEVEQLEATVKHWHERYIASRERIFALEKQLAEVLKVINRAKIV